MTSNEYYTYMCSELMSRGRYLPGASDSSRVWKGSGTTSSEAPESPKAEGLSAETQEAKKFMNDLGSVWKTAKTAVQCVPRSSHGDFSRYPAWKAGQENEWMDRFTLFG